MPKLRGKDVYNAKTDTVEVIYYSGRKKATPEQIKSHIKENFSKIDKSVLPKEYRTYYGRIEGGKKRAAQAVRIEGKFVNNQFIAKTGYPEMARLRGYGSTNELFKNDPEAAQAAKELRDSEAGLKFKYHSENVLNAIDTFNGKIFINGKEVTKLQAIERIDNLDKTIKRQYGNFLNEFWCKYKKGGSEIHFTLISKSKVETTSLEDLLEFLENQEEDTLEILESESKELDREEAEEKKKKKYTYKIKFIYRKKKKTLTIVDYNADFAREQITSRFSNARILSVERIAKQK